jgi:transposase
LKLLFPVFKVEAALTGQVVRVYTLPTEQSRLDATSASSYREVVQAGLFQRGHSKDHRPDLQQLKGMLGTLAPLGMPLACEVASGEMPDDPLSVPAIERVRAGLQQASLLYVGDCKMAALATRAFLQASGDFYLCPLSQVQLPAAAMEAYLQPVLDQQQTLLPVYQDTDRAYRGEYVTPQGSAPVAGTDVSAQGGARHRTGAAVEPVFAGADAD